MSAAAAGNWAAPLRQRWQALAPRERTGLLMAGLVLAVGLAWWWLLAPALKVLREAPPALHRLDRQLMTMRAQAQEIEALRRMPRAPRAAPADFAAQVSAKARAALGAQVRVDARPGQVVLAGEGLAAGPTLALMQELQALGGRVDELQLIADPTGSLKLSVVWRAPAER